jgi:SPP1 gp7 family putative phage head morphogenesis protein
VRITAFGRLVNLYRARLISLYRGRLPFLIENPEFVSNADFQAGVWRVAREMSREIAVANASSWRAAAMKSSNAKRIYEALNNEIRMYGLQPTLDAIARQNAELISSIPQYLGRQLTKHAAELQREGKRPEELARDIRRAIPHLAKSRIELIARTEISKAESSLTQLRAERLGFRFYQWSTSRDQRVRPSHQKMDNVIVAWQEPPNPEVLNGEKSSVAGHYNAGQTFQCRCAALPVVDLSEIHWPAKVYRNNRITVMTRPQFTRIAGLPVAA